MKRNFLFILSVSVLSFIFVACDKDKEEEEKATISFSSNDIVLDLGDSDADLLKYASASDGSTVTVSGVNYDLAGEQTAVFKAGSVTESKKVKIKADKIVGMYVISIPGGIGGDGAILYATKGNEYNQINLGTLINSTEPYQFLTDIAHLVFTFNAEQVSVPNYKGGVAFVPTPETATYTFTDIVYGKDGNGKYAIKSFIMNGIATGYTPFSFTATLTKTSEIVP